MTARLRRVVIDTNTYVSAVLSGSSVPAEAVEWALRFCKVYRSLDTWEELEEVLSREKFDRYRSLADRRKYFNYLTSAVDEVSVLTKVAVCRHPKDDKFLALAIDCRADIIITGDNDLLTLHSYRGIAMMTPSGFLAL